MMLLLLVALAAGAVAWSTRARRPGPGYGPPPVPAADPLADAQAGARHRIDRLAAGITLVDGVDADPAHRATARAAVAEASERLAAARTALATATTPHQVELAARCATEGLYALRTARTALGLDPGAPVDDEPVVAASSAASPGERWAVLDGQEYRYSPQPAPGTPYYYCGGTVAGRQVPAGWYSSPWWKTALVAGAAGLGGVLVADALFGALAHHGHGGPFGGPGSFDHHGGFGGFDGPGFGFGGFDGPGFGGPGGFAP